MKFGKRVIYRVINGLLQPRMSILCPLLIKLQAENLEELCKTMGISTWRIKNKKRDVRNFEKILERTINLDMGNLMPCHNGAIKRGYVSQEGTYREQMVNRKQ